MVEASFMGAGSGEGGSWTASFDVAHPMLEEKKREDNCVCVLHNLSGADRDETTKHSHFHELPVMMILREYDSFCSIAARADG